MAVLHRAARKGRVLLIGNFLSHIGLHSIGCELAPRLRRRSWTILTTSYRLTPAARILDFCATITFRQRAYDAAIVDVHSGRAFSWAEGAAMLLRRLRKPFIVVLRSGDLPDFARAHPKRMSGLLERAAFVVSPSAYLQDHMRQHYGDVKVIPNAVDLSSYHPRMHTERQANVVWLRSFHETYNPSMAVRALARGVESVPHMRLRMIGYDKGDGSLQRAMSVARDLGIAEHVEWLPPIEHHKVPLILANAGVFVNTANVDNAPVSILEAMAAGVPIVSTDVGGVPHLLKHGHSALLVRPGDDRGMADGVLQLFADPSLASKLSRSAREAVEAVDWLTVVPQWEALLSELMT